MISQDTSAYGVDVKFRTGFHGGKPVKTNFRQLCKSLGELGVWVRLHYVYPYPSVDEVIPLMSEGKILPYLDIPFQHASARILKRMKRPAAAEKVLERIRAWREACPDIAIRSTFIVGFPGETEEEFEMLLTFLKEARLDRVGCFAYSPVEGARANELPDPVPEDVKEDRRRRFMTLQARISREKLQAKVGRTLKVLVDAPGIGRSAADAPEIDGVVKFKGGTAGEFARHSNRSGRRARSARETGMSTREVMVVAGARTAIGDYGGALKDVAPTRLGAIAIKEAVARAKIDPATVGHVVMGSVIHGEARDMYLSRVAALDAGLPVGTPCLTVNRLCGSGLQAIVSAAQHILLGDTDIVVGGRRREHEPRGLLPACRPLGPAHGRRAGGGRDDRRAARPVRARPHGRHGGEHRRQVRLHARAAGCLRAGIAPARGERASTRATSRARSCPSS